MLTDFKWQSLPWLAEFIFETLKLFHLTATVLRMWPFSLEAGVQITSNEVILFRRLGCDQQAQQSTQLAEGLNPL